MVFFFGLLVTVVLYVRRVRGAIVCGMLAGTGLALALHHGLGLAASASGRCR